MARVRSYFVLHKSYFGGASIFYFFMFLLIVLPHKFFGTLHIIGFAILCGYTGSFASIVCCSESCDECCNRCPQRLKEFVLACRFSNASHPNLQYLSRLHILKKTRLSEFNKICFGQILCIFSYCLRVHNQIQNVSYQELIVKYHWRFQFCII